MAAGGHFGCPKLWAFQINTKLLFLFLQNGRRRPFCWMSEISLSIAFLAISDRYATWNFFLNVIFFYKMPAVGHFGCSKITFGRISGHFRPIRNFFLFFLQNGCRRPFWMSEIHFGSHFWPFSGCRWPFWMYENHFRSHFYSFHIDTQLFINNLESFDKMADVSHFECLNFTFDRISGHSRSIRNFNFFLNFWQNGWRRPFRMSEIHCRSHFWPFLIDLPFWMSEIHFRLHFWPFQIYTDLNNLFKFWMSENHFWSHFWPFHIDTQLFWFLFVTKWPPAAILDGSTMSIIELVRDIWMNNACVKFEERSLNPSKVIALTTKLWRGWPRGGCVADGNIIFPKTYVSREYNCHTGILGQTATNNDYI